MIYIPGQAIVETAYEGGKQVVETAYEGGKEVAGGTIDVAKDAAGAGLDSVEDLSADVEDLPGAVQKLADDPVGYLEDTLGDLAWDQVKGSVAKGFEDMLEGVAREAGLAPLVDGLDAFADYAGEVVEKIIQLARCAPVAAQSAFYALVAGLYAARVAGLVGGKDDCERFVKTGEFVNAIGANVPVLDMLPCAIEAAFSIPLPPSDRPPTPEGAPRKEIVERLKSGLESSTIEHALGVAGTDSLLAARMAARPPAVGAVSRSADKLDIAVARPNDGAVVTAAWEPGDKAWRGWWAIADGLATPGAPVTAVSRSADKLDVFMVGVDGRVWTAAWEPDSKDWKGWWAIGDLKTLPGTTVGAVSRSPDKLDVFATGADGVVRTAAWEPGDKAWRGWWAIADGLATPGAPVTAVSRSADKLDVFMVGLDARVWTAAWEPSDKAWRGWWAIGDLVTAPATEVAAVSRSADRLDVFVRGIDRGTYTAAWEPGDKAWRGWWRLT